MAEYPRTVVEFRDWFADEAACRDYLVRLRWPEGFCCPVCGGPDHWVTERGLRHCRGCSRQTSVTAGTLPDASAKSLEPAIAAAIEIGSQVRTDDWKGYSGLDRLGYRHQIVRSSAEVGENLLPLASGVAVEAMAARHAPRSGQRCAHRLLLGRVHFPLQPPQIRVARPAIPAADPASRRSQPRPCQRNPRRRLTNTQLIEVT